VSPRAPDIRFRVDPGDVPAEKAARRLHLSIERFNELLPTLRKRGFPAADPDTGMYDLTEIDLWRKERHRGRPIVAALTAAPAIPQPAPQNQPGMADRFLAARERQTQRRRRHSGTA